MTSPKVRTALIIGIVGAVLLGVGIGVRSRSGPPPPASAPSWLEFSPDEAQKKKMTELLAGLSAGEPRFPKEAQRQLENAKLFMYMAGTSEDEAVVLEGEVVLHRTWLGAVEAVDATYALGRVSR